MRMNEQSQQEEDRRNDSGMDDYEEWMYSIKKDAAQQALAATDDRPITVNKER